MDGVTERAGRSLRRAPYAWLTATLAVDWLLLTVQARPADAADDGEPLVALTLAAVAFVVWGVASSLVLVPRFVVPAMRSRGADGEAALLAWTVAAAPYLVAWAAVVAGAHTWVLGTGFFVSVGLLVLVARGLRRDGPPART